MQIRNQKIIITCGTSASGKSTWAAEFVQQNKEFHNLNRDDIRTSICCSREIWTQGKEFEELVTKIQEFAAKEVLKSGKSLVISDTNLNTRTIRRWQEIASDFDAEFEINDSFLSVPLSVCLERDAARNHPVGAAVIKRQYEMIKKLKPLTPVRKIEKIVQDIKLPHAAIFDMDGTLAIMNKDDKTAPNYRNPYDASTCENDLLNEPVKILLDLYEKAGYTIFIVSGREDKYRPQTERWLIKYGVAYDFLLMRKSGDYRKDSDVKEDIYRNEICNNYRIDAVIDDRLRVCKRVYQLGLPLFRVGDPEADF